MEVFLFKSLVIVGGKSQRKTKKACDFILCSKISTFLVAVVSSNNLNLRNYIRIMLCYAYTLVVVAVVF